MTLTDERPSGTYNPTRWRPEGCFAVQVLDSANVPELQPGDIVIVDPWAELESHDFVYIEVRYAKSRHRTFRQYYEYAGSGIRLTALNKNFRTYRLGAHREPAVAILGKAIELSRLLSQHGGRGTVRSVA